MSRGGRGGGRGGGASGRGGGVFATGSSLMGGLSYKEVMEEAHKASNAKLFPQAPLPDFADPTNRELRAHSYMKTYLRKLRFSAYHVAIPQRKNENQTNYSDRFHDHTDELPSLMSDEQKARMNPEFFPAQTWQSYYSKKARTAKKQPKKVKREGGAADLVGPDAPEGEEKAAEENASGEEDEEADEFDDEEENADYDNNYFEGGDEDEEEGGPGGEGGGDEGGTFD